MFIVAIAGPTRVLAESHSVLLTLHPSTALDISYTALTSDTQPYDLESAFISATIEADIVPSFGFVATSLRFDAGQTYFTETDLIVDNMFMGVSYDEKVNPVDLFARLPPVPLLATPSGSGFAAFDTSPLDYTVYQGFVIFSSETFPGLFEVYFFEDSNMVVPLTGSGSMRLFPNHSSQTAEVIVTLPLDATADSPWSTFSFAGNLVLTGSLPLPSQALPLPPMVGGAAALFFAAAGWRRLRTSEVLS